MFRHQKLAGKKEGRGVTDSRMGGGDSRGEEPWVPLVIIKRQPTAAQHEREHVF